MGQALVFASIILGVAVAHELGNLHSLIRSQNVRWHWAQPIFALYTLLSITFFWWLIASDSTGAITLGEFLPVMFLLVLFVLLAAVSLPDRIPDDGIDLATYYQHTRRYMWGLVALIFGALTIRVSWQARSLFDSPGDYLAMMGLNWFVVAIAVTLMFVSRWWFVAAAYIFFLSGPLFFWSRQTLG